MNETGIENITVVEEPASPDRSSAGIRTQLLWSSLFPLAFFGLLCTLALSSALNQMVQSLALQRNAAQIHLAADALERNGSGQAEFEPAVLDAALAGIAPPDGSRLFVVDPQAGRVVSSSTGSSLPLPLDDLLAVTRGQGDGSRVLENPATRDKVFAAYAPLTGGQRSVVLIEPWNGVMAPAYSYELILAGLLAIGIALSLGMLSLSIGRVIRPISILADKAARAVPDSIFHPLPVYGPSEIRRLIDAFNRMVIRLAEQQASVRQYAHKALLSQERERERLSHELHDGTLQDLLSLSQRVELCRNEMETNPEGALRRLDELHRMLEKNVDDVRRISSALRPPVLEDLGLSIALDSLCKDLQQDRPELTCEFAVAGPERRLQPDLELAVYRVIQEALVNIRKHARDATRVQVELTYGEADLRARVKNDGAVFVERDMRSLVKSGHLGLAGMYERTRLFGGRLDIGADEDKRTVLTLQMPFNRDSLLDESPIPIDG
jgi:signal transduction histidine kinase